MVVFDKWLEQEAVEQPEGELRYEALVESDRLDDEELMDQLGRDVARNYVNPNELALVFDDPRPHRGPLPARDRAAGLV
ncbi:hypothetical protein ACFVOR_36860 [Streptomyces sp. NPDC057837]|uniref:hypothetical protein n=1 Tax=Streptomyces sp. NPDC057837 TaxID=3346260 RepID=UPI0036BC8186